MNVLITGGAGFLGHQVVSYFLEHTDYDLVLLDRLDFSGNLNRLAEVEGWDSGRVKFVWHDLKAAINDQVAKRIGDVDYILHLAAGSHVDRSIEYPMEFVMDNVVGTTNLLNYARTLKNLKLFNYFSTDESFGDAPDGVNFSEDTRHNPKNPYAATKAAAEDLCIAFENTYKLPIFITHTMNLFGPRQHPEKFIPLVIKAVLNGTEIVIHSHPDLKRAGSRFYIHTENVAAALKYLLHNASSGEIYNIVGEKEIDNLVLAQFIANYIGKPLHYRMVDFHSRRPGHDLRYSLSGEKMKNMGWEYPSTFERSMRTNIEWYLDNLEWL